MLEMMATHSPPQYISECVSHCIFFHLGLSHSQQLDIMTYARTKYY